MTTAEKLAYQKTLVATLIADWYSELDLDETRFVDQCVEALENDNLLTDSQEDELEELVTLYQDEEDDDFEDDEEDEDENYQNF